MDYSNSVLSGAQGNCFCFLGDTLMPPIVKDHLSVHEHPDPVVRQSLDAIHSFFVDAKEPVGDDDGVVCG